MLDVNRVPFRAKSAVIMNDPQNKGKSARVVQIWKNRVFVQLDGKENEVNKGFTVTDCRLLKVVGGNVAAVGAGAAADGFNRAAAVNSGFSQGRGSRGGRGSDWGQRNGGGRGRGYGRGGRILKGARVKIIKGMYKGNTGEVTFQNNDRIGYVYY